MRTRLAVRLSLVAATLLAGCGSSNGATGAPTRMAPASPGVSSSYPLVSRESYPIPQEPIPVTMTGAQTAPPSPSSMSTAAASLVPSVPSTPTIVPSHASPTNSVLDALNDQTMGLLTASPDYQAIIQRGDRALQIVPAHATDQAS